jgi:NitT/TauT family transport system substrate-binding protein
MPFIRSLAVALFALGALGGAAQAQPKQEKLDLILNWVPGGDHVPYYYAKKMGWYRDAGIDLNIEPGKGSALAVQKVGAGANQIGLADMANALVGRSKGPTSSACSTSTRTRRRASTG